MTLLLWLAALIRNSGGTSLPPIIGAKAKNPTVAIVAPTKRTVTSITTS